MVTPKLIKSAASHAEILFAISQSDETSSVVLDTTIQHRTTVKLSTTKRNLNQISGNTHAES